MVGWFQGLPSLPISRGVRVQKVPPQPRHMDEGAKSKTKRPILDPPSPVIGSQVSQISTHATTACGGLLSALDSTRLTPPQEPESLQQRAAPSTTFPPSNDGTALQLFAAAHRLPGHIGSHDFVSHIRPGNGDVFPSALGPIPLRFFGRPLYTSRGCRRPLPYYWTSTVWVPGLLISLRLGHGGVSAGTLPRPPLLGLHASQRDWKCGLGSRSAGGCRYCLAPSHKTGLTFRDCRRLFPIPSTPTCRFSQLGSASDIPTEHGFSSRSRGLKSTSPGKPRNGVRNDQWGPAKTQAPIVSVASPAHSGRLDILPSSTRLPATVLGT